MPHYRDGTLAHEGDIIKGLGYNVKHEVIGKVLALTPGDTCNVTLACMTKESQVFQLLNGAPAQAKVEPTIEYGETRAFDKIA